MACAVEQAPSRLAAAGCLRTEIELPGALRYLDRLCRSIHDALAIVRGLLPARFAALAPTVQDFATVLDEGSVLTALRDQVSDYLPELPTPLGFNPPRRNAAAAVRRRQHQVGRDPPTALVDPPDRAGRRPDEPGVTHE